MKNILIIVLFTINLLHSQTIKNIDGVGKEYAQPGVYYQDVNFVFDPFVGTWLYSNGSTSFKIVLRKITNFNNGYNFEDLIVGEYEYIENGVSLINTILNLLTTTPNKIPNEIFGDSVLSKYVFPPCNDCAVNEYRLKMIMGDTLKDVGFDLIARRIWHNNQAALSISFYCDGLKYSGTTIDDTTIEAVGQTMPDGTFIFIKQP